MDPPTLSVLYWNCQTLVNKKMQFILAMNDLLERDIIVDVFCISECRLSSQSYNDHLADFHPQYHSLYYPSHDHNNGGLLFLIHNTLSYHPYPDLSIIPPEHSSFSSDIRWIKVNYQSNRGQEYLIGSIYINPQTTRSTHLAPLFSSISRATATGLPLVLGGDFNSYHPSWNNQSNAIQASKRNIIGSKLYDTITNCRLSILNVLLDDTPSYTHIGSESVLDLILCSDSSLSLSFRVLSDSLFDSDHRPVMCELLSSSSVNPSQHLSGRGSRRLWRCKEAEDSKWIEYKLLLDERITRDQLCESLDVYINVLESKGWLRGKHDESQMIINTLWNNIYTLIMLVSERTIGIKLIKPHHKFWFVHPHIQELLRTQVHLRCLFLQTRAIHQRLLSRYHSSSSDEKHAQEPRILESRLNLHQVRRSWKDSVSAFYGSIKQLRQTNWSNLIKQMNNPAENNQVQWKVFNRTLGSRHVNANRIKDADGVIPVDQRQSLNNLAVHFAAISSHGSIPRHERIATFSHYCASHFSDSLRNSCINPIFLNQSDPQFMSANNDPISLSDVKSFCSSMPTNTALGWDFLSPFLLKNGTNLLFECLHKYFTIIYKMGLIPSDWLLSNIFPLYKSGDKHSPENFRPISLTPIIVRLYERLLLPKIWHILNTNNTIHPFQAGFRKNHGTLDCLYWFTQQINRKFTMKRPPRVKPFLPVMFLDLKKAFDKISIPMVLKKLHTCGISGNLLLFFQAFLTNRRIRSIHFDEFSDWHSIDTGTPQGSVLGPILFSIYINDLIRRLVDLDNGIQPIAFADDLALVPTLLDDSLESTIVRLQQSLDVCTEWAKENLMTFSKEKSNLICFRSSKLLDPFTSDKISHLRLGGYLLEEFPVKVVDSYKYLGIKFCAYIKQLFTLHWEDLITSVRHRTYQVCRSIDPQTTPIMVGIQLVISIIRSKIGYSLALLSTTRKDIISRLESLIVRTLKRILGLPRNAPNLAVLAECGISPVHIWKDKLTIQLAHRISTLPPSHETSLQFYSHDYSLDHQGIPSSRSCKSLLTSLGNRIKFLEGKLPGTSPRFINLDNHRNIDYKELKYKELELAHKNWVESNVGSSLKHLKPTRFASVKREFYIIHDKPHISRLRARCRFNKVRTNEILYKYKQSSSPNCPHCNGSTESIQHLLMDCAHYMLARQELIDQLKNNFHASLSLPIILGDFRLLSLPRRSLLDILEWTGSFIEYITKTRNIY